MPPRVVLDACVLFPTVMREMLLGTAGLGVYVPLWSARILEEWARAARRLGEGAEDIARGEIALMRSDFRASEVAADDGLTETLYLPDENDRHVLATALTGDAELLLTKNLRDFPGRVLAKHGVLPLDPDRFLFDLHQEDADLVGVARRVQERAEAASGRPQPVRALLKRAGLPRLGRALEQA